MRCLEDLSALRGPPRLRELSGWFECLDLRHLPSSLTKLAVLGVVGLVRGMPGLAAPPGEGGQAGQQQEVDAEAPQQPEQQVQQPEQQGQQAEQQQAEQQQAERQQAERQQAERQQAERQQAEQQQAEQQQAEQQQAEQQQQHQYPALRHLVLVFEEDGHWELDVLTQRMQFLALLGSMLPSLRHLALLTQLPYHLKAMPAAIAPPSNGEVRREGARRGAGRVAPCRVPSHAAPPASVYIGPGHHVNDASVCSSLSQSPYHQAPCLPPPPPQVLAGLTALESLQVPEPWEAMPTHLAPLHAALTSLSFAQFELGELALRAVVEGVTALGALRELVVHPRGSWPPALVGRLRQALPSCRLQAPQLGMQGEL